MRSYHCRLGGEPVAVLAPRADEFDPGAFRATFPAGGLYGFDVETTALGPLAQWAPDFRVRLLQFATTEVAWVLDPTCPKQRQESLALLAEPSTCFASHTAMDALSTAVQFGVDITARTVDTRVLANVAHTAKHEKRDLKSLATRYGMAELAEADAELYERFRQMWPGERGAAKADIEAYGWNTVSTDDDTYLRYAGLDPIAALRLAELLTTASSAPYELIEKEVWLGGRAIRVQLNGMRVDTELLAEVHAAAELGAGTANAVIVEETGGQNPKIARSPKLLEWFAEHGADWSRWEEHGGLLTDTGSPALAKESVRVLLRLDLDDTGKRVAEHLIDFKSHQDALTKTTEVAARLGPDGKIHSTLIPNGATQTARMSSSAPNCQNFSADLRHLFIPDPDWLLGTIDFDQVELRVVAALAREQKMIDVILAGGDLHQLTAEEIGIPRQLAKMTNFLIVYGGGGKALSEQAGIPLADAYEIVRSFRDRYQAIAALAKYLGAQSDAVYSISRRRLAVTRTKDGDARSYANINYVVQSSARELLVDAWHRFDVEFGFGRHVWYPIHDELVLHVPANRQEEIFAAAERAMQFDFRGVPITASAIVLRDAAGVSRWMSSKDAEQIASVAA